MAIRDHYEPGRPCWVDLSTPDPAAARSFYGELFGWTADVDPRPEAGGYAQFKHDDHVVAGVGPTQGEGAPAAWTTYFATDDVDATAAAVTANGGTLIQPPLDVFDAGRLAVFAAPDGAVAGLWQAGKTIGAGWVNEPGGWSWTELLTHDKQGALAFYGAVFDWRLAEHPDWGEFLALGGEGGEIGSITQTATGPLAVPSYWLVTFMVDDADECQLRAQDMGAPILHNVEDTRMGGRVGVLADPQGASFSILSFAKPPGS